MTSPELLMTSSPPEADRAGRLRIAFVSDTFDEGLGGAMVSAGRFVRAMRARHEVRVVSAGAPNDPGRIPVPGFRLPIHEMKAMRFTAAIPRREILRRAFEGVDVVHLQLPFWLAFGAARMAREMRIPVVAAFHVQPENLLMNVGVRSERLASALYRFWVKRLYQRADAVVCPSRFAQEKLVRHGLTTPSFVVSNGAPRTVPRSRWTREPEYRDAFLVLAAGRFAIEKRHDVLFDALRLAKHTDRIRLVVAGDGPRKDELIRLARDLPHPTDIGYVSDERLARLYHTADLLVHCGEIELEGMVVLESLSCGLPALVADAPESAAVQFALGREFLFPPGDARALAERLDFWIEHPHALAVARERAEAQSRAYDFESCVERLEDVYRYVIGRRSGRGPAPSRSHD